MQVTSVWRLPHKDTSARITLKFAPVPLSEAGGKILGHNIAGANGQRLLRKGKPLTDHDLEKLEALGRTSVYVAELEPDDVDENRAARRVAEAVGGTGLYISGGSSGRANLHSDRMGILRIDADQLGRVNDHNGVTVATLATHTPVQARQIVATVKIIPYALPESVVSQVEGIANPVHSIPVSKKANGANESRNIVRVDALPSHSVGMILSGSNSIHQKLSSDFVPLRERIERLGSSLARTDFIALDDAADETALAEMLKQQVSAGMKLILIAGETAIMDTHDIVPRAVERAGGHVESVGAPVDPGNLLMLAYVNGIPIIGAPGCARSKKINIVDWLLPRLLVGDRLTRRDIVELGHGGLLQDVRERGMPREITNENANQEND